MKKDGNSVPAEEMRRRGVVPMYQVLKADLQQSIRNGELKVGERVPSESVLIAKYHVSSTTARRCLDELESEGLLERKRGKGTFVSGMAAMLNRQRVAVVVKDFFSLTHPFLATVLGTIEHTLESQGVHVVVIRAKSDVDSKHLIDLITHESANYSLLLSNMPLSLVHPLTEKGIHCLGVNTRYLDPAIPHVSLDFAAVQMMALKELAQRGHRDIVILTQEPPMKNVGVLNSSSLMDEVYFSVRRQFPDLPEHPLIFQLDPREGLQKQIGAILKRKPRPTALICWDELAALEVLRIFSDHNIDVPEEISLVGSRLLPFSPVACVDLPLAVMARTAAEALLGWMHGEKPENRLIPPSGFLARDTIGPVPKN